MRQRGAGYGKSARFLVHRADIPTGYRTRKIKDVDFGFSFGSPGLPQPQLARRSPRFSPPNPSDDLKIAEAQTPPEQQASSPKGTPPESRINGKDQQTPPIHSRNGLPERPSTFDIPPDDVPEEGRSSKRRKLGMRSIYILVEGIYVLIREIRAHFR